MVAINSMYKHDNYADTTHLNGHTSPPLYI